MKMLNNTSYKLMSNNNEKKDYNAGVSAGTRKF